MMGKKDDITIIEDQMKNVLHHCKLDSMVTVDEIKRWHNAGIEEAMKKER